MTIIDKRAAILGSRIQRGYDPAARVPAPVAKRVPANVSPVKKAAPVVAQAVSKPVTCCKYCHVGGDLVILYKDRLVCTNCEQVTWFSASAAGPATKRVATAAVQARPVETGRTHCEKCGAGPEHLTRNQDALRCGLCDHLTLRFPGRKIQPKAMDSAGQLDEVWFVARTSCGKCGTDKPELLIKREVLLECRLCGHLTPRMWV